MKLALVAVTLLSSAVAHADDPGMQIMQLMMRCPAISADAKHVAAYSSAPGDDKDSRTHLAVFATGGKLEKSLSVVPPAVDVTRATRDATAIAKLLDDGGYKRMSRIKTDGIPKQDGNKYTAKLLSEDIALDFTIEKRKVSITGTRGTAKLAPITIALPAKDGPCKGVTGYGMANTMAGYDKATKQLAFEVEVEAKDEVCFAHPYVITLK